MQTSDVVIVGGGPAGAAAAITLARAGREVMVVDKAAFPRDKCCGDGLTALALRWCERLGLDPHAIASWRAVGAVSIRSPSGRWVELPLPDDDGQHVAVARRRELDAALLGVARVAGAEVLDGRAVVAARSGDDRVAVRLDDGRAVQARYLIGADGIWSPTRKLLGAAHPEGYRGEWHGFRQYFRDVGARAASSLVVWFEPDLLPGYAWSFPVGDGGANVGFGILRDRGRPVQDMKWLWPDLLERTQVREVLGPGAEPEGPHRAWPIPARIDQVVLARGRALWAGDAAAASDPMTGEGIGQALETGVRAAEALLAAGARRPDAARRHYERRVRRDLFPDHRLSRLLIGSLQHRRGVQYPLWLVDRSDWTRRNFARWLLEDYPRAAILTPWRWRRRLFTGPGAYADGPVGPPVPGARDAGYQPGSGTGSTDPTSDTRTGFCY